MNEQNDNSDERLESMLRRWGADQAAREALVPPAPVATRPRRSRALVVLGWFSTAAAAGILVFVGVLYLAPTWLGRAPRAERAVPHEPRDAGNLRRELAQARGALDTATTALTEAQKRLTDAVVRAERAETELARLRRIQQVGMTGSDELRGKLTEAQRAREQAEGDLKLASAQLQTARTRLAAVTAERDKLQDDMKTWPARLAEATAELERLQKMHDAAMAAGKKAQAQLTALKAARKAMLADLQRPFLGLAEGQPDSLAVRQAAMKREKIIRRLMALRPTAQEEPTRRLLDKLEVALTRLSMLDVNDSAAAEALGQLVAAGGLVDQIEDVLAQGTAPPKMRMWLLEASLILLGVDRVV